MLEEFGHLDGHGKNRYWEIRLPKSNFLIATNNWFHKVCWYILTLIMLPFLFLFAKYYGSKLKLNNNKNPLLGHQYFTDIYIGCVSSPFVKGYELELFNECKMDEPILEIGIGDGYFSSLLFKLKNKRLTYGADLIYGTVKSATKYTYCENFLVMDALEIPFPDNSIGTILMNNLIHHLSDRELILKEAMRVLRKGGKFIFTDNLIGWGTFTWEQLLLKKMHLNKLAAKILEFKLKLFAQKLLVDDNYYEKKATVYNFKINKKINFVSKTSMYLNSLFEFLNLKQGQPTRKEMITWIKLFGLKNRIDNYVNNIIKYCTVMDKELGQSEGYAFQFFEMEKVDGGEGYKNNSLLYACPKCKKSLEKNINFFCNRCNIEYPIADGIPIFISYQKELKDFDSYLDRKRQEKSEDFVT